MGDDDPIGTLIKELKELRLRETELINRIEQANRQRQGGRTSNSDEHASRGRLTALREGDRVYIKNFIRKSVFRGDNRIIIDVVLLHYRVHIHLPANRTTRVKMQGCDLLPRVNVLFQNHFRSGEVGV